MTSLNDTHALSNEHQVREVASVFIKMSDAIHFALRELAGRDAPTSTSAYALLTEEYALRSRANMLMIEAQRFARPGLGIRQNEMLDTLELFYIRLKAANGLDELAELIISVVLLANSIASVKNHIVSFLLADLKESV